MSKTGEASGGSLAIATGELGGEGEAGEFGGGEGWGERAEAVAPGKGTA